MSNAVKKIGHVTRARARTAALFRHLLLCGALTGPVGATANTEHTVTVADGKRPYLLVTADSEGASQRTPGIYVADETGSWHLAVPGNVLSGRFSAGLHHLLELNGYTGRYEGMFVLDGVPTLASVLSKPQDPPSFLRFGTDVAVLDPLHHSSVRLPKITSLDDFAIFTGPAAQTGQVVLCSIKQPAHSLIGDGVTFAFVLGPKGSRHPGQLVLQGEPTILEYKWRPGTELRKLRDNLPQLHNGEIRPFAVVSPLLLQSMVRSLPSDPPLLTKWRKRLPAILRAHTWDKTTPLYDVAKGQPFMPDELGEVLFNRNGSIQQNGDPLQQLHSVWFHCGNSGWNHMAGSIQARPDGEFQIYGTRQSDAVALLVDDSLRLILLERDQPFAGVLGTPKGQLQDLALHVVKIPRPNSKHPDYGVLLSQTIDGKSETSFVHLRIVGRTFEVLKELPINTHFYPAEMLAHRLVVPREAFLLFDDQTPPQETSAAYEQARKKTAPYVDVMASHPGDVQQAYLEPLEEKKLTSVFTYRRYDAQGARKKIAGVFFGEGAKPAVDGELLQLPKQPQAAVGSVKIKVPGTDTTATLTAALVDAQHRKGENGFAVALLAEDETRKARFAVGAPSVNASVGRLRSTMFLRGRDRAQDQFYLFLVFDGPNAAAAGTTMLVAGRLSVTGDDGERELRLEVQRTDRVAEESLSETQILERIRRNDDGKLFWANDVRNTTTASWKLHDLVTRREVLPNTASERSRTKYVHLTDDEVSPDAGNGPSRRGSWEVLTQYSLEGKLKDAAKEGTKDKFDEERLVESLKGFDTLFPLLAETLEAAADPTKPPQRRVILVDEKLKKTLLRTVLGRWVERDAKRLWTSTNDRLRFHAFHPKRSSQPLVLENLEALSNAPTGNRAVLLADAEEVFDAGRVDVTGDDVPVRLDLAAPTDGGEPETITPHLLYWLGTDGETIPLAQLSPPQAPKFSQLIFATPEQWESLKAEAEPEVAAGLEQRFVLDRNHLYADWKMWAPETGQSSQRVKEVAKRPVTGFESEIFPSLAALLESAANPANPAEHRVIIVPAPLKQAVGDLMLQQWVRGAERGQKWTHKNRHLELAYFDPGVSNAGQTALLKNLDTLRTTPDNKRAILIAELDKVNTRPPASGDGAYELEETLLEGGGVTLSGSSRTFPPHMLYLLATEGRRLKFEEYEQEDKTPHRKVGMLLIGTEEEWETMQRDLGPENRIGLADRFRVERLDPPSEETRKRLLRRVLDRPEIASIRYQFDASGVIQDNKLAGLSADEQLDKLLAFAVSRCQGLASENGKEPISSFLDFVAVFGRSLIEDETIRRRRTLDRMAVERLFSKIFPMPINVGNLPPEDPLRRLGSPNFAFEWQGAGYESSIELKAKVVKTLLGQTRIDPVKKIPSSVILYGESRSGKTYLFETLCKTLGIKRYDYSRPKDPNAQALVINVGKLRPDPEGKEKKGNGQDNGDEDRLPPASESMTVSEAVRHLHNFLTLPNGYRGHILFDDVHQAPEKVRSQIITLLRTLFEADRGLYRIPKPDGSVEEVQVRNLSLYMTLNPTDDQDRRRKFVTPASGELGEVLAALGGNEVNEVRSFLERWSLVLNISRFPAEAKAPKLRDSLRRAGQDVFNNQGKLVLVSPGAVQLTAQRFANDNANFLSRATPALIAQALGLEGDVPLAVVVPNSRGVASLGRPSQPHYPEVGGRIGVDVEPFVDEHTIAVPVHGRFDGQLELLRILVGTLRTQAFEAFVRSIGEDPRFAAEADQRRLLLGPTLNAMVAHVSERGFLPMEHLRLDPADFGVKTEIERDRFRRAIHAEPDLNVSFFPIRFGDELPVPGFYEELVRGAFGGGDRQRNRADVLTETADKLRTSLDRYLRMLLGIDPNADLPTPDKWLLGMKKKEPESEERKLAQEFGEHFLQFYEQLFDNTLTEALDASGFSSVSPYDAARLYLLAVDKAITKLPWGQVLKLVTSGLDLARDMSYGQRPGVQHFLFESQLSLLRPTTPERLLHRATNSSSYRDWSDERRNRQRDTFGNRCATMLVQEVKS